MACAELEGLRKQASKIKQELDERRRKMRSFRGQTTPGHPATESDYEWFLQRRLHKASAQIEQHLAQHKCEAD
jgi:hypothetical protein